MTLIDRSAVHDPSWPTQVDIYDTTLRDGSQLEGISLTVDDKLRIAEQLDRLGVAFIEGGWPGANPKDDEFFERAKTELDLSTSTFVAFGSTRRAKGKVDSDQTLTNLVAAGTEVVCIVGKCWDYHVTEALKTTLDEGVAMVADSVEYLVAQGKRVFFDAEHFFDGFKRNPEFSLRVVEAAAMAGAEAVVLCDTNGGSLPPDVEAAVGAVVDHVDCQVGIHLHNDTGCGVANALAAVRAGATQVQGTINGLGERCGNADLISLIPTLVLKLGYETSIAEENLPKLMQLSRMLDERLNRAPNPQAPYVGEAAFAHKGGLHASAAQKDPRTYEHVPPEKVGNSRQYLVSDQAGKSNMMARFAEFGIEVDAADPRLDKLIRVVKEREFDGWAFDSAEASFELLARRTLGEVPDYFNIGRFRVMDERRFNARGELVVESEATATITVGNVIYHEVALGNGPVNAVDTALRKALSSAYPSLEEVELVDYKVRILDAREGHSGTGAVTRVLIEFRTPDGTTWRTVGLSTNIIDASVVALGDGMIWKLQRDGVPGPAAAA